MGYKIRPQTKNGLKINNSSIGETIEHKVERIVQNKEPIKDGAPLIYTERKDGVQAGYDIRTDRFEIAIEATDKISKSILAERESKGKVIDLKNNGKAESIGGTGESQ